jgi:uncharacterized protein (DUF486 family)
MPSAPPSRTERLVRSVVLLLTSAVLTAIAWLFGLYRSQDPTIVAILALVIVIAAVGVSRFGAKTLVRRFGWK